LQRKWGRPGALGGPVRILILVGVDATPSSALPGHVKRRVRRPRLNRSSSVPATFLSSGLALAVALGWIPIRTDQPDVLVALVLVVVITSAGASGSRSSVLVTAFVAALAFTFFDTEPYERLIISRQPDIETAISLVVVGIITGELAVRVTRQRRNDHSAAGDLNRVRAASSLMALGEELVVMIGSVAEELAATLDLQDCWYSTDPLPPGTAVVDRQGHLAGDPAGPTALPVWGLGRVLGYFVLEARTVLSVRQEQLLVAVTLADQVGAALAAQAPTTAPVDPVAPGPSDSMPTLRVVRDV